MLDNAWIIPLLPAAAFVLTLAFGKRFKAHAHWIGLSAVGLSFVMALVVNIQWFGHVNDAEAAGASGHEFSVEPITKSWDWWQVGGVKIEAGMLLDGMGVMMLFVVTLISLLVHVYSTDYVSGDRRYVHYYAFLSLFTASMLGLIMSSNTLQLIVMWELVGMCSFALIGHWWEEKPNADAALKAFITNRVGDVGLLVGTIVLFFAAGQTFDIVKINTLANEGGISQTALLVGSLALLAAVMHLSRRG